MPPPEGEPVVLVDRSAIVAVLREVLGPQELNAVDADADVDV